MHNEHEEEHIPHECDGAGHEHHHHPDGSCCCEQHAQEFHGIEKPLLIRLIVSAALYLCGMLLPVGETVEAVLMAVSALVAGYDIIFSALKNIVKLRFFDEYFLMAFAAVAACVIGEFEEGAAVFLLYRIGESCQSYAIRHSRKTIASLTGEAAQHVDESSHVSDRFITKFARIYTPIVLLFAVVIAVLLPLLSDTTVKDAVYRALTFLVLACPCAIVISIPLTYFAGIGAASRKGMFFRDSAALDAAAKQQPDQSALQRIDVQGKAAWVYSLSGKADVHSAELVMTGEQADIAAAVAVAKRTRRIIHENIWFTILVKLTVLVLAVCNISALWFAVFADSGVTIIVVLNALRAFAVRKKV